MGAVRDRLRDPLVWGNAFLLVKAAGAAVIAWVLARSVFGLAQPFLAPWAALLTVHATVYRTFARVTVPICLPAILDIAIYLFVNALTTVSAVVFLYGASSKLASISIVHMDEAGATAAAAAMATLIVATALAVKLLHLVLEQHVFAKLQIWRQR